MLDQYLITDKLGQGSFGIVYKAHKKDKPDKVYAIKCVSKQKVEFLKYIYK